MSRRTVNAVILLGIIAVVSILIVQVVWIRTTQSIQATTIAIQEKEDSLNLIHFTEQVHISLRNVLEAISTQKADSSDLYGAVKQVRVNYYTVDINEELHPYYLETLLKREFYSQNLRESFQYGIYDCFTDSIVFGNLIRFTQNSLYEPASDTALGITSPGMSWKKDGHYFTVYFPDVSPRNGAENTAVTSPYFYLAIIVVLVLLFFAFAVSVILKQKRLSEVKTDFINNMTHELKTPISTIGLSAEMLMRREVVDDPERIHRFAGLIFKENKRLQSQVERVLNVAKLDKEEISLKCEPFDMHELIQEAKENFDFNQNEKGGTISLDLRADRFEPTVDPVHISNVVFNLIDNAVKYCTGTPEVKIRSFNEKNFFVFEVEDNGIGIKKDDQKMIFDKFYRVPTGNVHDVKGFGLGLYYVKLIVKAHHGTISLRSTPGKGTVFTVKIPLNYLRA